MRRDNRGFMEQTNTKQRRMWVAVVLALFCPGLGHVYGGRLGLGLTISFVPTYLWVAAVTVATAVGAPLLTTFSVLIPLALAVYLGQMAWAGSLVKKLPADYVLKWFNRKLVYVAIFAVIILVPGTELVKWFVVESFKQASGSMAPTILTNDHFFARKLRYHPARGDIVVFHHPKIEDRSFVKRIVALGGDTIAVQNNVLQLNGAPVAQKKLAEPCAVQELDDMGSGWIKRPCVAFEEQLGSARYRVIHDTPAMNSINVEEQVVPAGFIFVLGDNRDNSLDSRVFGPVAAGKIIGKAESIFWSSGPDGMRQDRLGKTLH